ncbi:MAG: hypothetical protein U0992_10130 [Planctomycetaceae bacterium]
MPRADITDAGLQHLSGLTDLATLDLQSAPITDAGLVHLSNLQHLDRLCLTGTQVHGPGLAHLRSARAGQGPVRRHAAG